MAPQHALAALLSLTAVASAQYTTPTTSMFWTYTSKLVDFTSLSVYSRGVASATPRTYTITSSRQIKDTVTPTATPTSTSTRILSSYDMKVIYQYYPAGAAAESDLVSTRDYYASTTTTETSTYITYYMPVTMTAPASCPTQFTVTTSATVSVPSQVTAQITPTSTIDRGLTTRNSYVYDFQTWYLSAGAAPFTSTEDYYYRNYISSCSVPPGARSTSTYRDSGNSGSGSSGRYDSDTCYRYSYYCGTPLLTWIIIVATIIPGLFLLGFLESWFWFRRLMLGKSAMRFGTVCWVLMSLWVLCFTRMQDARSKEDQVVLRENWKNMGSGKAFKAWWKWGFRHAYPVEHLGQFSKQTVGVVPAGAPLHPAMAQVPPGFAPGFAPGAPPPGAPGQPGPVYYYGAPPGWVPTPDGQGFMPPQGGPYAQPQQGFYGADVSKNGTMTSSSPVSALGQQHQGPYAPPQQGPGVPRGDVSPQAPQPVHPAQTANIPTQSPPQQASVPAQAPAAAAPAAPVSEAPSNPAQTTSNAPQAPAHKNDPNDRSLYE